MQPKRAKINWTAKQATTLAKAYLEIEEDNAADHNKKTKAVMLQE